MLCIVLGSQRVESPQMDSQLLSGTLEMLILDVISHRRSYGYEIAQEVLSRSRSYFQLTEGSLYPALHRLERQRFLSAEWERIDGRRRKYYRLTAAGKQALAAKRDEWREFARGVNGVLGVADGLA
jgi:PadR family transcriptional regulator, regulatory protein PadR